MKKKEKHRITKLSSEDYLNKFLFEYSCYYIPDDMSYEEACRLLEMPCDAPVGKMEMIYASGIRYQYNNWLVPKEKVEAECKRLGWEYNG